MDVGDKNSLLIYKYYLDLVYYTNTLCIKYPKACFSKWNKTIFI